MTSIAILETLARENSISPEQIQHALEMLDAGLSAPFIGRFRRSHLSGMPESYVRRLQRRRTELEDLDRRRGTILRLLEKEPSVTPADLDAIRGCMDRFELEDLFVPHRRPEPEVQLAIDRGLAPLADLLVAPTPKSERSVDQPRTEGDDDEKDEDEPSDESVAGSSTVEPSGESAAETHAAPHAVPADENTAAPNEAQIAALTEVPTATAVADESEEDAPAAAPTLEAPSAVVPQVDAKAAMNAALARMCIDFVRPDKGIHTESEALSGALRILSDRLGRNAKLRGTIRNLLRKHGVLSLRQAVEDARMGRHRSLLKLRQPLRQLQGHRLLAIRQAQKERVVNAVLTLDPKIAMPKVRNALGRHLNPAFRPVLDEISLQALQHRLLPMVEADVRLELKERGDQEALRFLAQHLRQVLLASVLPRNPVAGVDVNPKGDWTIVPLDEDGRPLGPDVRIETKTEAGDKTPEVLAAELAAVLAPHRIRHLAIGNGKGPRTAALKLRAALRTTGQPSWVMEVNEAGLSSYASSEMARKELSELTVPARMAVSLGRRLQDPMHEILKVDPRNLGLGSEQGLVSKANAKRIFQETIESCTALAGCDVNRAPLAFLANLPGLDRAAAERIVAKRAEKPFTTREDLRADGVLTEAQWTSVAGFVRVYDGPEALDCSNLHPEQYPLARKLFETAGVAVEQGLGRPGATRGLRRADFDVDEGTWRDLMRELAFPGRDPRPRLFGPTLLEPETDPIRLTKDRVVEGIVTNVASFGVFIDIGLASDALVHISEISDRYVRDARELIPVGEVVRARILDASSPRLALSLKNVPSPERQERSGGERGPRGPRREGAPGGDRQGAPGQGGPGGPPRRGRRGDRGAERQQQPTGPVRAAQTRRDGIGGRSGGDKKRGGGDRKDTRRDPAFADAGDREDVARLSALRPENKPANNPFANFFKEKKTE